MARGKVVTTVAKNPLKETTRVVSENAVKVYNLKHGFQSIGTHCIKYISPEAKRVIETNDNVNIISFDLDDTLIKTKSGVKFARTADDWKWWNEVVPKKLHTYIDQPSSLVVVFTNQGGVTNNEPPAKPSVSLEKLLGRLHLVVSALSPVPVMVYAATKKSSADTKLNRGSPSQLHALYRKPGAGMWTQLVSDLQGTDIASSVYVGDAAGRKKDFSDSDKVFAAGVGVDFLTPEEFFEQ